ncbi:oxygenase MpaB family protein [Armatimonas sp.]|uniref:oxygenase MpaB family protein n=1 Tax=Armatimonas sp. TaxID=1872638 RepID=UPI00286C1FE2|nr:oxygenase MpaB family protein [Armatimonas sp.]
MMSRKQAVIEQARTRLITPRKTPPSWLDFEQLLLAGSFQAKRQAFIQQVEGASSLAATFAARDIAPILMQTGRLPKDFTPRMQETAELMNRVMGRFTSREDFLKRNYAEAIALGELHQQVGEMAGRTLKWNPRERLPMNAQSFAFVLYTFAWWPIEALIARKLVEPGKDSKELDAWFHYWSVLGHGMGLDRELLPLSYALAKERVDLLRQAQYTRAGEPRPEGIPLLLGGQVRFIATMLVTKLGGAPPEKSASEKLYAFGAQALFGMIVLSPGLKEALGLEKDATTQLIRFAQRETVSSRPARPLRP